MQSIWGEGGVGERICTLFGGGGGGGGRIWLTFCRKICRHIKPKTNVTIMFSQGMLDEAKKKNVYKKLICGPLTESQTPGIEADEYDATVLHGALCTAHIKPGAVDEMLRIVKAGKLTW